MFFRLKFKRLFDEKEALAEELHEERQERKTAENLAQIAHFDAANRVDRLTEEVETLAELLSEARQMRDDDRVSLQKV